MSRRFDFGDVGPIVPALARVIDLFRCCSHRVRFRVSMDPFEVRMQFLSLIRKLNASALLSSRSNLHLTQPHQLTAINPESRRLCPQVLLPVR